MRIKEVRFVEDGAIEKTKPSIENGVLTIAYEVNSFEDLGGMAYVIYRLPSEECTEEIVFSCALDEPNSIAPDSDSKENLEALDDERVAEAIKRHADEALRKEIVKHHISKIKEREDYDALKKRAEKLEKLLETDEDTALLLLTDDGIGRVDRLEIQIRLAVLFGVDEEIAREATDVLFENVSETPKKKKKGASRPKP